MTAIQNQILSHEEIQHKIKRIAYQIYETFVDEKEIIIVGIKSEGLIFASKIAQSLKDISDIKITLCDIEMDKKNPHLPITISIEKEAYTNKSVVLVDDVLNSGSTLIYAVKHFLDVPLKKFKTVVLVDRNHKRFPIKADFKGISLSTSLMEHVSVVFSETGDAVYLQ
ncbi:phosphoribosyltransferase [Flavobacteriaceae bacterium R38]|nr:phosphoribosyltransferase [Flavobacteriaceae bacterium R38]